MQPDNLYAPKEMVLRMQALGFNYNVTAYYPIITNRAILLRQDEIIKEGRIPAPLWQIVLDWLREEFDMHVKIEHIYINRVDKERSYYWVIKFGNIVNKMNPDENKYLFYYSAMMAGISEALKMLEL